LPASVTGYHESGGSMSRYYIYRRGVIFSNGTGMNTDDKAFEQEMEQLEMNLHEILPSVLLQLAQHYQLPSGWFQDNMRPTAQ
jgi:hypothetical protein